ncbi:putative leader peptide [Actinacidiphila sp. ITFR-21]|uniref:putative leader peptide n=1 Tax=Actinacidiphila sp. ITFR-21 TaxID=3075199 RepID=UPI00288AEA1B|nr:putative leader peptide [Streptomyces sp. ITFR-21]WNI19384.1 putative leader peptide [Streptomyces sp. ITFR-21]
MRAQHERAVHGVPSPMTGSFHPAVVRVLVSRGPRVRLYGRQHIDLLRVAGALCCR